MTAVNAYVRGEKELARERLRALRMSDLLKMVSCSGGSPCGASPRRPRAASGISAVFAARWGEGRHHLAKAD
jgi:hypothetical protein